MNDFLGTMASIGNFRARAKLRRKRLTTGGGGAKVRDRRRSKMGFLWQSGAIRADSGFQMRDKRMREWWGEVCWDADFSNPA
jgi:hypothetical protein